MQLTHYIQSLTQRKTIKINNLEKTQKWSLAKKHRSTVPTVKGPPLLRTSLHPKPITLRAGRAVKTPKLFISKNRLLNLLSNCERAQLFLNATESNPVAGVQRHCDSNLQHLFPTVFSFSSFLSTRLNLTVWLNINPLSPSPKLMLAALIRCKSPRYKLHTIQYKRKA